jgi:4-amino-4-deoxy-L-arabinose transferase-like glycosyltransferase
MDGQFDFSQSSETFSRCGLVRRFSSSARWSWCWLLAPLIAFSFSRSLIATYAMTSIAPFAVIAAQWLEPCDSRAKERWLITSAVGAVLIYALVARIAPTQTKLQSARALVAEASYKGRLATETGVFLNRYKFSGNYYPSSHAVYVESASNLKPWLARHGSWLIGPSEDVIELKSLGHVELVFGTRRAMLARVLPYGTP